MKHNRSAPFKPQVNDVCGLDDSTQIKITRVTSVFIDGHTRKSAFSGGRFTDRITRFRRVRYPHLHLIRRYG